MNKKSEPTFYLIYSPSMCANLLLTNQNPPYYMFYGYYISGCPTEPDKINFKGSYRECQDVVYHLTSFTMN